MCAYAIIMQLLDSYFGQACLNHAFKTRPTVPVHRDKLGWSLRMTTSRKTAMLSEIVHVSLIDETKLLSRSRKELSSISLPFQIKKDVINKPSVHVEEMFTDFIESKKWVIFPYICMVVGKNVPTAVQV